MDEKKAEDLIRELEGAEVTELDDADLAGVAGGMVADNCNCSCDAGGEVIADNCNCSCAAT